VAKLDTAMTFTAVGTLGDGGVLGNLGTLVGGSASNLLHPSLLWSTYLGGSGADEGTGIGLDPGGNVYVTGDTVPLSTTASSDFLTTGASSTTTAAGSRAVGPCIDVFVAKLRGNGSGMTYASRFGGSGDDKGAALGGKLRSQLGRLGTVVRNARGGIVLRSAPRAEQQELGRVLQALETGCTPCFPAGTTVATPRGTRAIERLHVGERVWAENPTTGKVEAEPLEAVRIEPVQPLVEVDLSDGSVVRATPTHAFWLDGGVGLQGQGWLVASKLRPGDLLRTVRGADVHVVRLRRQAGHAVVYTLTVAKDHTFFVGAAQVLVHNADGPCIQAVRDAAYTTSRHTIDGAQVVRDLKRGREAHIFNDGADLDQLERLVLTQGIAKGNIRGFDRFVYVSDTPIGRRIQAGRDDIPLYVIELKGKMLDNGKWVYHIVPRTRPATS